MSAGDGSDAQTNMQTTMDTQPQLQPRPPPPLRTHNNEADDDDDDDGVSWDAEHDTLRQAVMSAYAAAGTPSAHHPSTLKSALLASASRGGSTRDLHAVAAALPILIGGSSILGVGDATTVDTTSPEDDDGNITDESSAEDDDSSEPESAAATEQHRAAAATAEEDSDEWYSSSSDEDEDNDSQDGDHPHHPQDAAGVIRARLNNRRESRHRRLPSYAHLFPPPDAKIPQVNIENHGVIGNLLTCALISTDAQVDWMCFPHFDSPPIFHSLLDAQHGGTFKITAGNELPAHAPDGHYGDCGASSTSLFSPRTMGTTACADGHSADLSQAHRMSTRQMYCHETNCLLTRFFTESGVGHVTDFMPVGEVAERYNARSWLVREVEVVRGKMYFEIDCTPSFDWGRQSHTVTILPYGALFTSNDMTLLLTSSRQRPWALTHNGLGVKTRVKLQEGQRVVFVLREWRESEEREAWEKARLKREQAERQKRFMHEQIDKLWAEAHAAATGGASASASASGDGPASTPGSDWGEPKERNRISGSQISPMFSQRSLSKADLRILTPSHGHTPKTTSSSTPAARASKFSSKITCGVGEFGIHTIQPIPARRTDRLHKNTMDYWAAWLEPCTYTGRWREVIRRCALVLKLLTFEPTGAIIQAPTCCPFDVQHAHSGSGLPNAIGKPGADYRFVSLRDASFTAAAFLRLGFRNEVNAWMGWLAARCAESQEADGKMQQVYGLRGETKLDAIVLPDVPGYKNSGPVTIGHAMSDRSTIDHYGAILISMYLSNKYCDPMSYETWTVTRKLVNYVCDHWADPVAGLWPDDANREPSHYLAAKLMCWVCLDRGIHLAQDRSFPAPLHEWRRIRNEIYCDIQDKGYNASLKRYTAAYDNTHLDAALLLMPITSFVAPTDPKFMSTLDAILKSVSDDGLMSHSMLHRYNVFDPIKGEYVFPQSTTTIGSFWAIEACTRGGLADKKHLDRARMLMEQMLGYTNHVGLFSECISLRGAFTGHFPHGLTHVALVRAAMYLDAALSHTRPTLLHTAMYEVQTPEITPHS